MIAGAILPCAIGPKADELLSSWLVRLSHRHALKVQTFVKLVFPGIQIWNRDIDKMAPRDVIETLASHTLTDIDRINQTSLKSYEGKLYLTHNSNGNTKWLLPLGIYHRVHRKFGLLFCSECLKRDGADPYFRKAWRLSFSVVCPECRIYLRDRCPVCNSPVIFFRTELGDRKKLPSDLISNCYKCGFNLSDCIPLTAPKRLVYQQRFLYRVLREGWQQNVFYPHLYFDVLYQVLNVLTGKHSRSEKLRNDMSIRFRHAGPLEYRPANQKGFDKEPLKNRIYYLRQALWLLEKNQENLLFLGQYHSLTSTILLKDMHEIPFWYHELVIDNFFVSNVNRRFDSIKFKKEETNLRLAPVNGLRGPHRKYSKEYTCGVCGSDWIIKDGIKRGKKMLRCRNCNKRFVV